MIGTAAIVRRARRRHRRTLDHRTVLNTRTGHTASSRPWSELPRPAGYPGQVRRRTADRHPGDRAVAGRGPGRRRGPRRGRHRAVRRARSATRDHDQGVTGLSYSAHPSAEAELRRVAEAVAEKFRVLGIAAVHRVGDLAVGDLAVVAAVACAHRGEAFDACRELIDVLKASVPIWKHQRFTDGTERVGRHAVNPRNVRNMSRRSLTLLIASVGVIAALAVAVLVPVPYVILGPGSDAEHAGQGLLRAAADHHLGPRHVSDHRAPEHGDRGLPGRSRRQHQHLQRAGRLAEPA